MVFSIVITGCVVSPGVVQPHQFVLLAHFLLDEFGRVESLTIFDVPWWDPYRPIRVAHLEWQLRPSTFRVTIEEREGSPSIVIHQVWRLLDKQLLESPVLQLALLYHEFHFIFVRESVFRHAFGELVDHQPVS